MKGITILSIRIFDERTREFTENIIGELNMGGAFGELAIIENKSRAATVICKTNCLFATLIKEDYQNILGFFWGKKYKFNEILLKFYYFRRISKKRTRR